MGDMSADDGVERTRTELLPCPFCGGRAKTMHLDYDGDASVWGVFCTDDLNAEYPHGHFIDNYGTEEEAIAVWNRRTE